MVCAHDHQEVLEMIARLEKVDGVKVSPWTGKVFTTAYQDAKERRSRLVVYKNEHLLKIHSALCASRAILITADTGARKSSGIPNILAWWQSIWCCHDFKKIVCALPRQVAAVSAQRPWPKCMDVDLGAFVGYRVEGKRLSTSLTGLEFLTDSLLVQNLTDRPDIPNFMRILIVDEAHERTVATDELLQIVHKHMWKNGDFKLIIMSATMDTQYFSSCLASFGPVCVDIKEPRQFALKIEYSEVLLNLEQQSDAIIRHVSSEDSGDVLIFLPSERHITTLLRQLVQKSLKDVKIFCLSKKQSKAKRDEAVGSKPKMGSRRIILADEVAESMLTIDGLDTVMDTGLHYVQHYNPERRSTILEMRAISKAIANQRAGRAGRTKAAGVSDSTRKSAMRRCGHSCNPV